MTALTCADAAPSGPTMRSTTRYAEWVRSDIAKPGTRTLPERAPGLLTNMEIDHVPSSHEDIQTLPRLPMEATGYHLMPDARYPDRWLNDRRIRRLSDRAHRVFVTSMAWSVSNRTDGRIEPDDIAELPTIPDRAVRDELVKSGLWSLDGQDYVMAEFDDTQTTAAELDRMARARLAERQKKARQRARVPRDVPRDSPRDDTGQARPELGQDQEEPATTPNGLGRCTACGGWEPLGPDRRCSPCTAWDVRGETG